MPKDIIYNFLKKNEGKYFLVNDLIKYTGISNTPRHLLTMIKEKYRYKINRKMMKNNFRAYYYGYEENRLCKTRKKK